MPLHLLGKKSWNVYNADNIARVRRDEAEARAREEADEQRMQEADAARRLAILRGEIPPPLEPEAPTDDPLPSLPRPRDGTARKRKRAGEDDTEFEMRVAREQQTAVASIPTPRPGLSAPASVSLTDSKGHISLFPPPETKALTKAERNPDVEREKARKERDLKDQYQMRFVNAGGSKEALGAGKVGPWYAAAGSTTVGDGDAMPSKDVWGNEDPRRKVREVARLGVSDPLAMMKRGAAKVRELGKERNREAEGREKEMEAMRREERRRRRRETDDRRRERSPDRRRETDGKRRERSPDMRRGESRRQEPLEHRRGDGRRDKDGRRDGKRHRDRGQDDTRHDRRHGEDDGRRDRSHRSRSMNRHGESYGSDEETTQKQKRPRNERDER
ncbi:hypothetical protein B0T18DRAFT_418723 [Schizothecium vesticola]|uniref:CBF1-interacting co-repressor CIR N-terminal domain-containing protein n=1 Tax=Schizothecium vesticola TaxID=314040 RepID=A0AA40JZU5_9PEZI|nr:hypothetical protein B0T18DRAFT_418723 [Schizothecium vesticola]